MENSAIEMVFDDEVDLSLESGYLFNLINKWRSQKLETPNQINAPWKK